MINYKFNEGNLIDEFQEYIDSTYGQHYAKDKFQATEFIIDGGHGTGFCIGNVLKYAQRYGKKGSHADARKDLMKVLHYALIQLYVHDQQADEFTPKDTVNTVYSSDYGDLTITSMLGDTVFDTNELTTLTITGLDK
jgi:hypothetical protein